MFSEASVASTSIIDRLCSPYAMIAESLYFSLPSEWLLKHKRKPGLGLKGLNPGEFVDGGR